MSSVPSWENIYSYLSESHWEILLNHYRNQGLAIVLFTAYQQTKSYINCVSQRPVLLNVLHGPCHEPSDSYYNPSSSSSAGIPERTIMFGCGSWYTLLLVALWWWLGWSPIYDYSKILLRIISLTVFASSITFCSILGHSFSIQFLVFQVISSMVSLFCALS